MAPSADRRLLPHIQRTLLAGVLILVPLWITWLVFRFILSQLSSAGMPWVRALGNTVEPYAPSVANWLRAPWFEPLIAVILTLVLLYLLGWAARLVIGRRILEAIDSLIGRIPIVQTVYGSTKKLVTALQQKPDGVQRIVLIPFPTPEMKTVGFVTRLLTDETTGQQLAAVYVPTTPNPTSGYLEIVPVDQIVSTEWTMDEAMSFIISGGAVAPDTLRYTPDDENRQSTAPQPAEDR